MSPAPIFWGNFLSQAPGEGRAGGGTTPRVYKVFASAEKNSNLKPTFINVRDGWVSGQKNSELELKHLFL